MARPIGYSPIVLTGDDAKRFNEYMQNPPPLSKEGRELLKDALKLSKTMKCFE